MNIRARVILPILLLLGLFTTSATLSGCSLFRGACASAIPVITKTQAYVHDAQLAVDQIELGLSAMDMPPDVKQKALGYIAQARDVIRSADRSLALGADACSKPDPFVLLKDLLELWPAIEALLGPYGQKLGAAPGTSGLGPAPLIVLEARARAGK